MQKLISCRFVTRLHRENINPVAVNILLGNELKIHENENSDGL